ncbi:hypothetical protein HF650_20780 [Kosakonia sp. SMBL-WEM22]|uniref:hypothetical protein n=1 Tax=Kosakonia sp. SMBL-WEM22 TaxID=2725560 RepID=UPI001659CD0A|nr:hypothetical protein [Kosakonia sp. SMBL-WEM22]MDV5353813.1 hypothetical protein [Enterobacter asburiae]QNQ21972.1 hypothetical protein HF650_20780 [Kosakonia sp. SMBL-WEM22]
MKSAKSSKNSVSKKIWIHAVDMFDAFVRGILSIAAFTCLFIFDGWLHKIGGFLGCFALICLIIYLSDKLKGSDA